MDLPGLRSAPRRGGVALRGMRLAMHLARTEPLKSMLALKAHSVDKTDMFWPGDADPNQVTACSVPATLHDCCEPLMRGL